MKKLLHFSLIHIILIFFISTVGWGQNNGAPEFFVENNSFDAGEVKEGSVIEHVFKVKNTGDSALEIKKVRPT